MTKVNRISSDLYEFINEDTMVAESFRGELAQKQIDKLNASASDTHRQDSKSYSYTVNLFWELVQNKVFTNNEFIEFCKNVESKSLQIPTGRSIFNEKKYKAKVKERDNQMRKLIDKYNVVIANLDFDLPTREREASNILKEFNALKSTIINKSEKQFYTEEFETISITAEEALEIVRKAHDNYNLKCSTDVENKRIIAIEQERDHFKDISPDDFKLIKQLQRLVDSSAFYKMFEYNPVYKYGAIHYDSLEDFINRDRGFESDVKLELSNSELSAVRFLSEVHKQFTDQIRTNKLKQDMVSMVSALKEK